MTNDEEIAALTMLVTLAAALLNKHGKSGKAEADQVLKILDTIGDDQ